MLRDRARGIGPKQTPDDRRKELIELASKSKDKDVPVYRGGKRPDYFTTEKEVLKDMYPKKFRGYGESTKEYLTPETEALFREVDDRARRAKEKIIDKYIAQTQEGKTLGKNTSFSKAMEELPVESKVRMYEELGDIDDKAERYKASHRETSVMMSKNDIPTKSRR